MLQSFLNIKKDLMQSSVRKLIIITEFDYKHHPKTTTITKLLKSLISSVELKSDEWNN